jgi:hypothetical protein
MRDKILTAGLAVILLVILLAAMVGCAQHGYIKVHRIDEQQGRKTTQTTEVRQPPGAIAPASLDMGFEPVDDMDATARAEAESPGFWASLFGAKKPVQAATTQPVSVPQKMTIRASTGASQPMDQALAQLTWLPAVGVGLCVVGVLLIVAKAWVPLLPLELGVGLLLLGVAVIALPMLLDRYLWILILVGIFFFAVNVWRLNKLESVRQFLGLKQSQTPEKKEEVL